MTLSPYWREIAKDHGINPDSDNAVELLRRRHIITRDCRELDIQIEESEVAAIIKTPAITESKHRDKYTFQLTQAFARLSKVRDLYHVPAML